MADINPVLTPDTTTPPPVAAPAPAVAPPDLSGLGQPGIQGTQEYADMQNAAKQYKADAATPVVAPPGPHARLFQMIQGLGVGLSAMGTSIGTGGKEGGAAQVVQVQGEQQRQKLEAQQQAQNLKNAKLDQDLKVFTTNQSLIQTSLSLATFNQETAKNAMLLKEETQKLAEGAQTLTKGQLDISSDAYQKMLGGQLTPSQYQTILHQSGTGAGTAAPAGPGGIPATAVALWQKPLIDASTSAYKDDPGVKQAADDFAAAQKLVTTDPDAAAQGMFQASTRAGYILDALQKGTASRTAAAGADKAVSDAAAAKVKADQDQLAMDTYKKSGSKQDFATWQAGATKAAETAASQGDPTIMGTLAAEGLLTVPQVALSRQMDKPGFEKFLAGADAESKRLGRPEIVLNGKPTGHYFNQNAATQQYDYVKEFNEPNSKTQLNIASNNKFIQHANDLNSKMQEYATTNVPLFNTPLNAIKKNFGDDTYSGVVAALAPVKAEYANALAAGFAPSADAQSQIDIIMNPASSPKMIQTASQQMTHSILRQMDAIDQQYQTHADGSHYPNMIFPDTQKALGQLGVDPGNLQSGGNFGGVPQVVNAGATGTTAPVSKFTADTTQPARTAKVPAGYVHGNGPHGPGWYDPSTFGGK